MAAAANPARRAASAVLLAVVAVGCPGPAVRPARPAGSETPASWAAVADLRGYALHAGSMVAGGIALAGEQTAGSSGGVLVRYDPAAGALEPPAHLADAAQIRAVTPAKSGRLLAGGIDTGGRGYLAAGPPWRRIPLPAAVTAIDAIAAAGAGFIAAGEAGDRGVVLTGDARGVLREAASLPPLPGRFARLDALATDGGAVVAVGTDGTRAVVLTGAAVARTWRRTVLPATALVSAAAGGGAFYAGGYAGPTDATRSGVLFRSRDGGRTWTRGVIPASVSVQAVAADGHTVVAATATGREDRLILSRDGGTTWSIIPLPGTSVPPTVEAVVIDEGFAWAFGASGLYRGPL